VIRQAEDAEIDVRDGAVRSPSQVSVRSLVAVFVAFLVGAFALNLVVLSRAPAVTPIDGLVYADAFDRAMAGEVVVEGMMIGENTRRLLACRGIHGVESFGVECGEAVPLDALPVGGQTSAFIHPPTYFFATAGIVRGAQAIWPDLEAYDAARLVNSLWTALGATLMVYLAVLWGARPWAAAGVMAAFLPTPTFVALNSFVTPDSMALLICSAILVGTTLWWKGRWPAWALLPVGLLAGLVKQTYLLAAVSGLILIAVLWLVQRSRPWQHHLRAAAALACGAGAAVIGWDLVKRALAIAPADLGVDPFSMPADLQGFLRITFTGAWALPGEAAADLMPIPFAAYGLASGLSIALAAAAAGAVLYTGRKDVRFVLGLAGVTAICFGGLLMSMLYFVSHGILLPPAARYVIGAFPLYALPLFLASAKRGVVIGAGLAAALGGLAWILFPGATVVV
jgi:hypothetical protein